MATGLSTANIDTALDTVVATATNYYVQFHVGDPGASGVSNPAGETARAAVQFAAASGGSKANSSAATLSAVSTTETWTFFSAWSASTGGTFEFSGTVSSGGVTAGDDISVDVGNLTVSIAGAA